MRCLKMLVSSLCSFSAEGCGGLVSHAGEYNPNCIAFIVFNRPALRRKKIKCDGVEPTCSQCSASGSQCTWLQTKDRAALSRQCVKSELLRNHIPISPLSRQLCSGT